MNDELKKMKEEATASRDAIGGLLTMFREMKPLTEEAATYVSRGERPPNELFAKIYRAVADATDRAMATMPGEMSTPLLQNNNRINHVLAEAYERGDEDTIALAQAEQMGANYLTILDMVEKMFEIFDDAVKEMELYEGIDNAIGEGPEFP